MHLEKYKEHIKEQLEKSLDQFHTDPGQSGEKELKLEARWKFKDAQLSMIQGWVAFQVARAFQRPITLYPAWVSVMAGWVTVTDQIS